MEGQIKSFPDKKNQKDFFITKPLLYEMLMGFQKKKTKTMYNEMAIKTYLSTIEYKKQTKQIRGAETESWIQRAF